MRVADRILSLLHDVGVDRAYLVTGRGSLFLTDAIARFGKIQSVANHHEQASAYAACAESMLTGKLALCLVSTGCAAVNALGGALTAWQDELPVIFVSGQHYSNENQIGDTRHFRTYGEQETDIISLAAPITKNAVSLRRADQVDEVLAKAVKLALTEPRGPVWIDIPLDIQSATYQLIGQSTKIDDQGSVSSRLSQNRIDVNEMVRELRAAKRPLLLIGANTRNLEAWENIPAFIEANRIPTVFEGAVPDIYGAGNTWSIGSVGAQGCSRAGNFAVQHADYILTVGATFRTSVLGDLPMDFARNARVTAADCSFGQARFDKFMPDTVCDADVAEFARMLGKVRVELQIDSWRETCLRWKDVMPTYDPSSLGRDEVGDIDAYDLCKLLDNYLPDKAVVVADSGFAQLIMPTNIRFRHGQRCLQPFSQGAMGYALPAAIGAAMSSDSPVIVVTGDGSIMMNLQELQTIAHGKLPIKILVLVNGVYGIIRKRQQELFRNRTIGTDESNGISCPDFQKIAEGFGLEYRSIGSYADAPRVLGELFELDQATICTVAMRHDQEYLRGGRVRLASGVSVPSTLDNLQPSLPESVYAIESQIGLAS
jgi:acetolactate synthase-1/2/3 large subunit